MTTSIATTRLQPALSGAAESIMKCDPLWGGDSSTQRPAARLVVRPQDIDFNDVGSGRVEIAVTVTNTGARQSRSSAVLIQSAVLGAFVDLRPLASLRISALEPGESATLRTMARRETPEPLGPPDRLPPARLLTALGFQDENARKSVGSTSGRPSLPPSPLDLLTGPSTYWAGNINVFVAGKAVERHMARALRIVPDRTNVAVFCVGGRPDSYRFELLGLGPDWDVAIMNPMQAVSVSRGLKDGSSIETGKWISLRGTSLVFLALRPPANCREADVAVQVTQYSTRKTAVVEFSFDARAAGPGCYVVD